MRWLLIWAGHPADRGCMLAQLGLYIAGSKRRNGTVFCRNGLYCLCGSRFRLTVAIGLLRSRWLHHAWLVMWWYIMHFLLELWECRLRGSNWPRLLFQFDVLHRLPMACINKQLQNATNGDTSHLCLRLKYTTEPHPLYVPHSCRTDIRIYNMSCWMQKPRRHVGGIVNLNKD